MSMYKKCKNRLFVWVSITIIGLIGQLKLDAQENSQLNVMVDCAYPVSDTQEFRQNLSQSLYALQHKNYSLTLDLLEESASMMTFRKLLSDDDRDYIQAMINQIDRLIAQLEQGQDKSRMIALSDQIKNVL